LISQSPGIEDILHLLLHGDSSYDSEQKKSGKKIGTEEDIKKWLKKIIQKTTVIRIIYSGFNHLNGKIIIGS